LDLETEIEQEEYIIKVNDLTEVCKLNICTNGYISGYNNNSHMNFISAENHNMNYVSIPKQKYRT